MTHQSKTSVSLPYLSESNKHQTLAPLLNQDWAMLLDSAGSNLNFNRFDLVVFCPSVSISFSHGNLKVTRHIADERIVWPESALNADRQANDSQPLSTMRDLLAEYKKIVSIPSNIGTQEVALPFCGGWLGYIAYDFGRTIEKLPSIAANDLEVPDLMFGLYQSAIITDHFAKTSTFYNFGLPDNEWNELSQHLFDILSDQSIQAPSRHTTPKHSALKQTNQFSFELTTEWQSNLTKAQYQLAFEKIQKFIHEGDCYQVNFAQRFSANYSGEAFQAYRKLSNVNQAPFSSYLNLPGFEVLSLSPERFIESHQGKVTTQPIKGTRPRSNDPILDAEQAKALINSQKDKAENLMIVDLLRNDLSRTAKNGSVKVTELFGHYQFESVHHLISTVESTLDERFDNFDLLQTTLPGGSITGAPKIRAMEIIESLEPVRRTVYCGIIGYIDFADNMDTNICIRTLIAKDQKLFCWAGGGIVADSEVDKEYQETFDKLNKILPILSNYSSAEPFSE